MIGTGHWAIGIACTWRNGAWAAGLKFYDGGFCNDDPTAGLISTEGTLHTRYYVNDLTAAIDAIRADATHLGITWNNAGKAIPALYVDGDGESDSVALPPDWRQHLAAQAARLGWETYALDGPGFHTYPTPEDVTR